jgi:hypothetical protein
MSDTHPLPSQADATPRPIPVRVLFDRGLHAALCALAERRKETLSATIRRAILEEGRRELGKHGMDVAMGCVERL